MPNAHDRLTLHFPLMILKMCFGNEISANLLLVGAVMLLAIFNFGGFHFLSFTAKIKLLPNISVLRYIKYYA